MFDIYKYWKAGMHSQNSNFKNIKAGISLPLHCNEKNLE